MELHEERIEMPQDRNINSEESDLIQIPIAELLVAIWHRRRWLVKLTALGCLLSAGVAFLIPNQYTSTAQLMPPDQQSLSNTSMLNSITGMGSLLSASAGAGGLMSVKTPGQTVIGILSSRTAQDDIINRFDLRRVYRCKLYIDARAKLEKRTSMDEDKKTGLVSISVTDRDRYRARDLAGAYIEELNKLLNTLNTSSAHRERIFLEDRLKSLKNDLDAASIKLSQFSSRNATLNPQTQGQALIEAAAKLQGELITAQSELYGLKAQYSDDNVRVRVVQARIEELQSQLRKIGGIGENESSANLKADQLYPSIRELPILGVTYSDLYRKMMMEESIYETLTKQYELSRVEEAKEIPVIRVLDEPAVPETKSFPHRIMLVLFGTLATAFVGIIWIISRKYWEITDTSQPAKAAIFKFLRSVRTHIPSNT